MFSVAKAIIIGSGTVAVATGAFVVEAPQPKALVAKSASHNTPIANVPIIQASSKPVIISPVMVAPQTCADGSSASGGCFALQPSPPPPPPPPPANPNAGIITIPAPAAAQVPTQAVATAQCASLGNPAWAANSPVNLPDTVCLATKTCDSLLKPADDSNNDYPMLTAGRRYYVTPRTDGVTLPVGAPPAVVAVPADGAISTTMNQVFSASCFQ